MEWQPIETAPKDEPFLVHLAYGYVTRGWFVNGKYFAADSFGPGGKSEDTRPTHWMPLPKPPVS